MHDARLWRPGKNKVHCELCSHFCAIKPNERGKCGVRQNVDGRLMTLVYDTVAAMNLDPIEKKPLYHFLPGTTSFSIGTMGCNLSCAFCQNWTLSFPPKEGREVRGERITPAQLVETAKRYGAASMSYTYSEPTIFFELVQDSSRLAVDAGLKNVLVSNGFMTGKCLDELKGVVHAANVDLKAFTEDFYADVCGARLKPVLENLVAIKKLGWWLEVTTLLIPGLNDADSELTAIATFIHDELGADTPWHISRFHPTFKLTDRPITPVERLDAAYRIGQAQGLKYIYVGNVPGERGNRTNCPECGCVCLDRNGFTVTGMGLEGGTCQACGADIAGVWTE